MTRRVLCSAAWTLQQLREALGYEHCYRYLIHVRDRIFAMSLDESIERLGLQVLKSPLRSPMANAILANASSERSGASVWIG